MDGMRHKVLHIFWRFNEYLKLPKLENSEMLQTRV